MKRRPDLMLTLVVLFCLGLVVSGFTTMNANAARGDMPVGASLSAQTLIAED